MTNADSDVGCCLLLAPEERPAQLIINPQASAKEPRPRRKQELSHCAVRERKTDSGASVKPEEKERNRGGDGAARNRGVPGLGRALRRP
jgi:hypothetical protein